MPANFTRRFFLGSLAVAASLPTLPAFAAANADREPTAADLIDPATQQAIEKALAYLAARQNDDDGSFGNSRWSRNPAICSLAGMAFMSGGSTPGRGPYGKHVNRCVSFVLNASQDSGFISVPIAASHGPMYEHGFSTLFLAEVYGMSPDTQVREKLSKAVDVIVRSQNKDGGWRYFPNTQDADISVTICQVMALRAARNAGVYVPNDTIDRCIDYVKRSQNADGGFMYQLTRGGASDFPRSAAGVVALYSAGIYEGDELSKGLDYLLQNLPRNNQLSRDSHYFYGHYYAVQAMWHAGGDKWRRWYPAIRDQIVARQQHDGSWQDFISPEYGTAMACMILQMPNNYLPIFQN